MFVTDRQVSVVMEMANGLLLSECSSELAIKVLKYWERVQSQCVSK